MGYTCNFASFQKDVYYHEALFTIYEKCIKDLIPCLSPCKKVVSSDGLTIGYIQLIMDLNCFYVWIGSIMPYLKSHAVTVPYHVFNSSYCTYLHANLSYPSIAGPYGLFDESPLLLKWQENRNRIKNLELDTWLGLASIYIKLSRWHDAELCLSKSEGITAFSASRWHTTGNHAWPFIRFKILSYWNSYFAVSYMWNNTLYGVENNQSRVLSDQLWTPFTVSRLCEKHVILSRMFDKFIVLISKWWKYSGIQ